MRSERDYFLPGDQTTLSSGRTIVLSSKMPNGVWRAQYLEDALKRNAEFILVRADELKRP